jgi:hypothetical protein
MAAARRRPMSGFPAFQKQSLRERDSPELIAPQATAHFRFREPLRINL